MTENSEKQQNAALTLLKGLGILEVLTSEGNMTIGQIASKLDLNRTTTHRLVQTLLSKDYVQVSDDGRTYQVGLRLLPMAARYLDHSAIRIAALPYLNQLAKETGQRTNLGVLLNERLLYLGGVEKPSLPNVYSRFGKMAPLHCCALGKAIVAFLPEEEREQLLKGTRLERQTPNTLTDLDALRADLQATADRGYALDRAEHVEGTYCVAAPVFSAQHIPLAAIGASGSNRDQIHDLGPKVVEVASVISHLISPPLTV